VRYDDAIFMPPASGFLLPDGMIETPNALLLLEMDMGTERFRRLRQKWESYRGFLQHPKEFYAQKPVAMFFILQNAKYFGRRKVGLSKSLLTHFSTLFSPQFDVFVDDSDSLQRLIQANYLSSVHPSSLILELFPQGTKLDLSPMWFSNEFFADGLVTLPNAPTMLLRSWLDQKLSLLTLISYFDRFSAAVEQSLSARLPLLVILPDVEKVSALSAILRRKMPESIFFTTPRLLSQYPDPKALFTFDAFGNLFEKGVSAVI